VTEAIKAFLRRLIDDFDPPPAGLAERIQAAGNVKRSA
jgi:hypothetical protein